MVQWSFLPPFNPSFFPPDSLSFLLHIFFIFNTNEKCHIFNIPTGIRRLWLWAPPVSTPSTLTIQSRDTLVFCSGSVYQFQFLVTANFFPGNLWTFSLHPPFRLILAFRVFLLLQNNNPNTHFEFKDVQRVFFCKYVAVCMIDLVKYGMTSSCSVFHLIIFPLKIPLNHYSLWMSSRHIQLESICSPGSAKKFS